MPDQCPEALNQTGPERRPLRRRLRLVPAVVICAVGLTAGSAVMASVAWGSTLPQPAPASGTPSTGGGTFTPLTAWN